MIRKLFVIGAGCALFFKSEIFTLALLVLGVAVLICKLFSACAERRY